MKAWARLGDTGTHGGNITTAARAVRAEGQFVARAGDIYTCPIHGPNPILPGVDSVTYRIEGAMLARHGDLTQCGASIIASAVKTFDV